MIRKLLLTVSAALIMLVFVAFRPSPAELLKIGAKAPMAEEKLIATDDSELSLEEAKGENGLLVMFTCNTCPVVGAWEYRYNEIAKICKKNKIGMIGLNPNAGRRDGGESIGDMKTRAEKSEYEFPYVLDKANKLADAFGATRTPELFLFNASLELVYSGAIDNSGGRGNVSEDYIVNAMNKMVAGEKITPSTTKSVGCGIKRVK